MLNFLFKSFKNLPYEFLGAGVCVCARTPACVHVTLVLIILVWLKLLTGVCEQCSALWLALLHVP